MSLGTFVFAAATSAAVFAGTASSAMASTPVGNVAPTLTATQASFTIPASPTGTYFLRLWTQKTAQMPGEWLGQVSGSSGTLTLPVPQVGCCMFQVDVRYTSATTTNATGSTWYSGLIATIPGCGQSGSGTRYTLGYWKNHGASLVQGLLPQDLGIQQLPLTYQVTTSAQAAAILADTSCSDAVDCLAAHLLAAELDVAYGSSICVEGTIFQAQFFMNEVNYNGPASYTITSAQRSTALTLESELDTYTNDGTSVSCS
ncbi:MAG TPA: hypothetical protein VGS21_04135 [Acidimicrobiales bacterium]|nr:hypothetical protein [Acidimicrobiales bacterium]